MQEELLCELNVEVKVLGYRWPNLGNGRKTERETKIILSFPISRRFSESIQPAPLIPAAHPSPGKRKKNISRDIVENSEEYKLTWNSHRRCPRDARSRDQGYVAIDSSSVCRPTAGQPGRLEEAPGDGASFGKMKAAGRHTHNTR
eukprot:1375107-Amorphochlora_amoeboformis.AAC.1